MNDVAQPTFVTVKRPTTMLPYDFKQAIEDLKRYALIGVQHVAGDFAVVARFPEELAIHIVDRDGDKDERGATFAADAQAGPAYHFPGKVESPRPRTNTRKQAPSVRRVVMRAPITGQESSRESALPTEVRHASSAVSKSRARVVKRADEKGPAASAAFAKQNGGGQHACRSSKGAHRGP